MKTSAARSRPPISGADRDLICERTRPLWEEARETRFFVTGGTGFFGCWILESLTAAEDQFGLELSATVLTRNPESFRARSPHLATHRAIRLLAGDVRDFAFPSGRFEYVIHGAFDSSREPGPEETRRTILEGTERCLELARLAKSRKLLLISSGAVYGRQPPDLTHVPEELAEETARTGTRSAYGEAKAKAERMALAASGDGLAVKIARGFAFVGPHLPLEGHFAIGNFIRDALSGGPIRVDGDGSPVRSYLYAADLAIWLFTILFRGRQGIAYNVGSEQEVTVHQLALRVASVLGPGLEVQVSAVPSGAPAERYVPSTRRARQELGLEPAVGLEEAIRRTAAWSRSAGSIPDGLSSV